MTVMSRELYAVASTLAAGARAGFLPDPFRVAGPAPHELPFGGKGVYIAVDVRGVVRYVGSVSRPRRNGVRERVVEHVRAWFKERHWTHIYVVPLSDETPATVVKMIEGRIGRRLRPLDNKRLPRR
jgi:hypothetical protein